jgi:aldose sugar dehydrogenase
MKHPFKRLLFSVLSVFAALLPSATALAQNTPGLKADLIATNLRQPWDIAFTPDGAMLFTEKCNGLSIRLADGKIQRLVGNSAEYPLRADDWFCAGQSGVHGVAIDPQFAQGQRFVYVFSASNKSSSPRSNRVMRFRVSEGAAENWRLSDRQDIVPDIAFKEFSYLGGPGSHSGGRMRFGPDGFLWITTGDNHDPDLPQDPKRLGGKVLRVDRDGKAAPGNITQSGFDQRIYTYGHRNPQGIAFRPAGGAGSAQVLTAEHGPNHSDEVNLLRAGANYGWDPRNRDALSCTERYCGYAGTPQTMPMTDLQRFPNAVSAVWNNNQRSEGIGPLEFLSGSQWGALNGTLVVAMMRSMKLQLLSLDASGKLLRDVAADLPSMRVRSLVQGPDGLLWASTDDGRLLRISLR